MKNDKLKKILDITRKVSKPQSVPFIDADIYKLGEYELEVPKGIGFKCQKCGKCCEQHEIFLWDSDIKRINRYLQKKRNSKLKKYIDKFYKTKEYKIISGKCVFLSEENLCLIHMKAPLMCKLFPFNVTPDKIVHVTFQEGCKGFYSGKMDIEILRRLSSLLGNFEEEIKKLNNY